MKKINLISALIVSSLMASVAHACMDHYFYQRGNNALFGNSDAMARLNRPAAKPKVFKVKHPGATVAIVDKDHQINVDYKLPADSTNVSLQFSATNNVQLVDEEIKLTDSDGTVTAKFRVKKKGIDTITVTVSGEHGGETLSYTSRVYVSTKAA